MNPEKKFLNGAILSSIVGTTLAGCSPFKVNALKEESAPEEQIIVKEDPILEDVFAIKKGQEFFLYDYHENQACRVDAEVTVEEVEEYLEEEEVEEVFDYTVLDIYGWNDFELESIEKKDPGYVVKVNSPTSLFVIPLRSDEFLDNKGSVEEIVLNEGMSLEISEVKKLKGGKGEEITVGLVGNTYGAKAVAGVIMGAKDSSGNEMSFIEEVETHENSVAYIALSDNIYPNKVYNTYVALLNISKLQDEQGILKSGRDYSYIDMIGLSDREKRAEYLTGFTSSKDRVRAGGVCAMATGMSLLVHQDENNEILEQWHHPIRYFQGPFSMSPFEVDATVQQGDERDYDFQWRLSQDRYLQINVDMSLSGVPYKDTASDGVGGLSDVNVIFSMSFTDEYPEGQTERLIEQMSSYSAFRSSKHTEVFESFESTKYSIEDIREAVNLIYDREDFGVFVERIEENETLKDIIFLGESINSYEEDSGFSLSDYLETTDWYENYLNDPGRNAEDLEYAMRILSQQVRVEGQPLQCVSYTIFLSTLYPEFQMQSIGGSGVEAAKELISKENIDLEGSAGTGYGGLLIGSESLGIEKYQKGDHFVTASNKYGHIGTILDVLEDEEGNRYLLVTDANRFADGRVKFFVVDSHSLEFVFGSNRRYIIRSAANHSAIVSQEEVN
jgi:hypothetical protein